MSELDNFDIDVDEQLNKSYLRNQENLARFNASAAKQEQENQQVLDQNFSNLAAIEAPEDEETPIGGFIDGVASFGKHLAIGTVKGVEETLSAFRAIDDNAWNLPEPKDISGSIGQGIGQFLPMFIGGGAVLRGGAKMAGLFQKSTKLSKAGQGLITLGAGGIADAVAFDPKDKNLGNLALSIGAISNDPKASAMVKEYLAQQDADSETVARLKNALTGAVAGAITEGLIRGTGYALKKTGVIKSKPKEAEVTEETLINELESEEAIPVVSKEQPIDEQELADAAKPIAEDTVDLLDKARTAGNSESILKNIQDTLPDKNEAIVADLSKSEAAINKWYDELEAEDPQGAEAIIKMFEDKANGQGVPLQQLLIQEGKYKGKALIESMNFLKLDTEEEARHAMQFMANKFEIKNLTKKPAADDFNEAMAEHLSEFDNTMDDEAIEHQIKQIRKVTNDIDEGIKLVEVSKVLAQINYEQLDAAAKAMVESGGSKESTELLQSRIRTGNMIHQAGGLLSQKGSQFLNAFKRKVKAVDNTSLLRSEATKKLHSKTPKIIQKTGDNFRNLKNQDTFIKKVEFEELKTTRKTRISKAETATGKKATKQIKRLTDGQRLLNKIKSLKKTLRSEKAPERGQPFPKRKPVTSPEVKQLQESIQKVRAERDTIENKFKKGAKEQLKLRAKFEKLSKDIKNIQDGTVPKKAEGKAKQTTVDIEKLKAEKKRLLTELNKGTDTQKNIDRLNAELNQLLLKRISKNKIEPLTPREITEAEATLKDAIKRENQKISERVTRQELEEALIEKSSLAVQAEINKMDLRQLKTRVTALNKSMTTKGMEVLHEVYINGLLSSVKTLAVVNPVGNASALLSTIIERAFAGATGNQIAMREATMLAWESIAGLKDAWYTFVSVLRKGTTDTAVKTDAIKVHERALSKEYFNTSGPLGAMIDFVGSAINMPGKILLAQDEAFKGLVMRGETRALAYRKARNKFSDQNLGDAAVKANIRKEFDEILDNIGDHPDVTDAARMTSLKNSFTNDLPDKIKIDPRTGKEVPTPGLTKLIQQGLDKYGLLRVFVPFFRTPANILTFTFERTPVLQFASKNLRRELTSDDEAVKQLARAKVGTSFAVTSVMFGAAMTGNFTGAPPTDRRLRANMEAKMGGPHWFSWNVNGEWHKYDRFDPFGVMMATAATAATMAKSMISLNGKFEEEGDPTGLIREKYDEVINSAAMGTIELLKDRHYVQGISEFISFVTADNRSLSPTFKRLAMFGNPGIGLYSSFRRGITQGTEVAKPRRLQRGAGAEDGLKKTGMAKIVDEMLQSHAEALASVTPGYGDIAPQKNLVGDVVAYPGTAGEFDTTFNLYQSMANPVPGLKKSKSPLINKLAELESTVSQPSSINKLGNIVLTETEKTFVIDKWTKLNKDIVEPMLKDSFFDRLPTVTQRTVLENLINNNRQVALNQALVKFEDRLQPAFIANKQREALRPLEDQPQGFQSLLNLGQQ